MSDTSALTANWVKDGTPAVEPVTVETPVAPPDPLPTPEPPARGPDGRFVAATDLPETPATPTVVAETSAVVAPVPVVAASPQTVQEFIDAQLGEGTFQIPKGVKLPLKRGDTVEYATIEELQKRGMLELDYRHKTTDLSRQRELVQAKERLVQTEQARIEARATWLAEQEAEMLAAQKDPDQWEAYQEMMRLYQANPQFRQRMDDALAKRETDAELAVYRERDAEQAKKEGVELARGWIKDLATEFPAVNPERVTALYSQALSAGQARLDPAAVRAIYESEAHHLLTSMGPLQQQLAELRAQVDALKAKTGAEQHNALTAHALTRAKAPPVAISGLPPIATGTGTPKPFHRNELPERNSAWVNQR